MIETVGRFTLKNIETIGRFTLKNEGIFQCQTAYEHIYQDGYWSRNIFAQALNYGQSYELPIKEAGLMRLYVLVIGGIDKPAQRYFNYDASNPRTANYLITGSTLNSHLTCEVTDG